MDATPQTEPVVQVSDDQEREAPAVALPRPSNKTPQEFYGEITKRPDIRAILEELANTASG